MHDGGSFFKPEIPSTHPGRETGRQLQAGEQGLRIKTHQRRVKLNTHHESLARSFGSKTRRGRVGSEPKACTRRPKRQMRSTSVAFRCIAVGGGAKGHASPST